MSLKSAVIFSVALFIAGGTTSPVARGDAHSETELLENLASQISAGSTSLLFFSDAERQVAFRSIEKLYPTRVIKAGSQTLALGERPMDLSAVTYTVEEKDYSLGDFLSMNASRGLLVAQDGNVVFEHYAEGNDRDSKWISFSVTKSVTSMLIGAAIQDGFIKNVDEPVVHYLPRLRGTGYENTSIRDVLQMASGVAWNEDYADPDSDVAKAGGLIGLELVTYLGTLPTEHAPGEVFNYNTGETNLAGEILRSAIGNNAATYLTHKIWQPFGMGSDATWLTGMEGGGETGGCCISATLRDYARIGLFALNDGVLADGTQVLPKGWMKASTNPSAGAGYYGYLWWLGEDSFAARGIFGQQIHIDPARDLVIATHSNAPTAVGSDYAEHLEAAIGAIREAF